MSKTAIKPCKKCGSDDILLSHCNYSSFNPGGGECNKCGFVSKNYVSCTPSQQELARVWNSGQRLDDSEKLLLERKKTRQLRKQLKVSSKENQQIELSALCKKFITDNEISCGESIWQCDRVSENAPEFIEQVAEIVGYHEDG